MIKVPNNKTIAFLAVRQLRFSWLKNFFSVMAVALTTMLIMIVMTVGHTFVKSGASAQKKNIGQKADVSFQYLLEDEVEAISSNSHVERVGVSRLVAGVREYPWIDTHLEVRSADEVYADMMYNLPETGSLPQNKDEVAVKAWMLNDLKIPCELGQIFPVSLDVEGKHYDLKLKVTGIINDNKTLFPFATAYISKDLADELLQKYTGSYIVESFSPQAVRWYRKHRPEIIRGQLSEAYTKQRKYK